MPELVSDAPTYSDIDDLLSDDFFDGRSLRDIFDSVDVQF